MALQKIMEQDDALRIYDEIKQKIIGEDIDDLVADIEVDEKEQKLQKKLKNTVFKAISCGLVEYNAEENCVTQKLIDPIKKGSLETRTQLHFRNRLSMKGLKFGNINDDTEKSISILSKVTGEPPVLLEEMHGQDSAIAMAIFQSFFDK